MFNKKILLAVNTLQIKDMDGLQSFKYDRPSVDQRTDVFLDAIWGSHCKNTLPLHDHWI